jgi:hypothetical protein
MPGQGSWPYFPTQCPHCRYVQEVKPTFVDDSGYEIVGYCRHPRIAMELFRPVRREPRESDRCPLFIAQTRAP